MFCLPRLVFGGIEVVKSRFYVLRARTRFRRYRGRPVSFSCFALPDSFSAVPRASGLVLMFCAPENVFGGTEGVRSRFHVLRSQTHFRRYRGCLIQFSCFPLSEMFLGVPRASCPFFMFCAPGFIFGGTEGVGTRLMFFVAGLIFGGTEGDGSPYHVFGGSEGIGSLFNVLRSLTHFRQYRGRRVPFSSFALSDSFSAVLRALGPFFIFCAPELVFDGTECVGSHCHVLRARTHFRRYRGRQVLFSCFRSRTRFRRYRGCRVSYSCFPRSDSFLGVPRASDPFFMFFAPELVFGSTADVGSFSHVLRSRTHFQRYKGRLVPFSCFASPE
jgi:hypothetical protein